MKPDTRLDTGELVQVQVSDGGDELERIVRHWNKQSYVIQNVECDGAGNIKLIFRKVNLFENYR